MFRKIIKPLISAYKEENNCISLQLYTCTVNILHKYMTFSLSLSSVVYIIKVSMFVAHTQIHNKLTLPNVFSLTV